MSVDDSIPTYEQALEALENDDNEILKQALFGFEIDDGEYVGQIEMALRSLLERPDLTPPQIMGIGRALHGMARLPLRTAGLDIQISLAVKDEGGAEEYVFYFTADSFSTESGGYIDSGHGSDSFSGPTFRIEQGYREYEDLSIYGSDWPQRFMGMGAGELKVVDLSKNDLLDWDHPKGSIFWEWIANHD